MPTKNFFPKNLKHLKIICDYEVLGIKLFYSELLLLWLLVVYDWSKQNVTYFDNYYTK